MTVEELLKVMTPSNRLIIKAGNKELYNNYASLLNLNEHAAELLAAEVLRFDFKTDITHKSYKELGLLPPLAPEDTPLYKFSDLELRLYHVITIREATT